MTAQRQRVFRCNHPTAHRKMLWRKPGTPQAQTHIEDRDTRTEQRKPVEEKSSATAELSWTSFGLVKRG